MFKQTLRLFTLSVFLLFSNGLLAQSPYSQIYVFGDSLSDIGNFGIATNALTSPPYFNNRLSNGPVAVEILANHLGLSLAPSIAYGNNYAVATARARGLEEVNLAAQVSRFLWLHANTAQADALYVIFIGGNDLRDARDTIDISDANAIVEAASSGVEQAVNELVLAGAKTILLVNAPNIGAIPETRFLSALTSKESRKLSNRYREQLKRIAEQYDKDLDYAESMGPHGDVTIIEFDLFKFMRKLLRKAPKLGFTNTSDACFEILIVSGIPVVNSNTNFNADCNSGINIDEFFFVDYIHPTARVHALVGDAFYSTLIRKAKHKKSKWRHPK